MQIFHTAAPNCVESSGQVSLDHDDLNYALARGDYDRQSAAAERVLAGMRSKRG